MAGRGHDAEEEGGMKKRERRTEVLTIKVTPTEARLVRAAACIYEGGSVTRYLRKTIEAQIECDASDSGYTARS